MKIQLLLYTFLTISITSLSTTLSQPHHYLKPPSSSLTFSPQQSIHLTLPSPTANLPLPQPECTLSLFNYSFVDSYSQDSQLPITVLYSPPDDCPPPWSHAVLQISGENSGDQYDRVAGVWLSGVEILRTSTPQPAENGSFWNVEKDISRYLSLLYEPNISLSMMLENLGNDEFSGIHRFTGVYDLSLTILFYKDDVAEKLGGRKLGLELGLGLGTGDYEEPADLVIPVSGKGDQGYWFRIENESEKGAGSIVIPSNARRIVLELYVSFHGNDEFWYTNPPTEYIEMNNLTSARGNGGYREVFVKVDGNFVGFEVPFPVIYSGGVNPFSWDPIAAIGAYDLPTYDFELTPFLGSLLDGKSHTFEIGVANSMSYWLVDANLHVWVDEESAFVEAMVGFNEPSEYEESRKYKFKQLDGSFEIEAERKSQSSGWVNSSLGNHTTTISQELKFKNKVEYQGTGTQKTVEQEVEVKTEVRVVSETGTLVSYKKTKREYPLTVSFSTIPGPELGTDVMTTAISNEFKEKSSDENVKTSIHNIQESEGTMLLKDNAVVSGRTVTRQTLSSKGQSGYFVRTAEAADGKLLRDDTSASLNNKLLNFW